MVFDYRATSNLAPLIHVKRLSCRSKAKKHKYADPEMLVAGNVYTECNLCCIVSIQTLMRCDSLKTAVPPCEVGTLTVTILLLAGRGSLVVTTFPPTEVPVICKVCPPDVATVVSVPAPNEAKKQKPNTVTFLNSII